MHEILEIENPAPVLNIPEFHIAFGGNDGQTIPLNENGHPFYNEFVALKGMTVQMHRKISKFIAHVSFDEYPHQNLYLDLRFTKKRGPPMRRIMPTREAILEHMLQLIGKPYVWGGNWSPGIPEILSFYPPKGPLIGKTKTLWTLDGVDCSGLLFEAAHGLTPRNTSQLMQYGIGLKISDLTLDQIIDILEPLDMILYSGHVLFVVDQKRIIESKSPYGVILRNLRERLGEIAKEKRPCDEWAGPLAPTERFIVRRFA